MIKRAVITTYAFVLLISLEIHVSESAASADPAASPDPEPLFRLIQLGEGGLLSRILSGVLGLVLNLVLGLVLSLLGGLGLLTVDTSDNLACFNCGLNTCDGCG